MCGDPLRRENKLIRLDESTLLNTAWTVEHASGTDRPVSYVLSRERPQPFVRRLLSTAS